MSFDMKDEALVSGYTSARRWPLGARPDSVHSPWTSCSARCVRAARRNRSQAVEAMTVLPFSVRAVARVVLPHRKPARRNVLQHETEHFHRSPLLLVCVLRLSFLIHLCLARASRIDCKNRRIGIPPPAPGTPN